MNKIYINPPDTGVDPGTGIGRVVVAQHKHLEKHGWKIVKKHSDADLIAVHVQQMDMPYVDITFCHGLYFDDIPHVTYSSYHHRVNKECIETVKMSRAVTVPSNWVAEPFRRDMRIDPIVIGHGIDVNEWQRDHINGYILWNKGRNTDVCDARPAYEMAKRGFNVVSTFYPAGEKKRLENFHEVGSQPFDKMKQLIQHAGVYLATTIETFGIGTLEAMASGVPILGYDWGGTSDIVTHKHDGYLVKYGDVDGLVEGMNYIAEHYQDMSANAMQTAQKYSWDNIMAKYALMFDMVLEQKRNDNNKVSIVITNYNYGKFIGQAFESCVNQTKKPDEIIIIDDGSTDDSKSIIEGLQSDVPVKKIYQQNQGVASSRNHAIEQAEGAYVTFLDADDKILPEFVEVLSKELEKDRSLGIAYTSLQMINEFDDFTGYSTYPPEFDWEVQATGGVPPANCIPSACMFRKNMWERAGDVNQTFAPGEDAEFWTRGLSVGFNARRVTTQPLFVYRNHSEGASKTKKYKPIDAWLPWINDKVYPLGAPVRKTGAINCYYFPMVSVIIPVGDGHEKYLGSAINSLIGQTYRFWECIVVDDTLNGIDQKYLKRYPFVRLYRTAGKMGAGHARNIGIDHANAPTVVFLDSDDFLSPNFLERAFDVYLKTGNYAYCDTVGMNGEERINYNSNEYNRKLFMTKPENLHGVTALVPTDVAKQVKFDEGLPFFEDTDFYMRLAYFGVTGVRCKDIYLYYRLTTSTRRPKDMEQKNEIGDKIKNNIVEMEKRGFKMGCCGDKEKAIADILKFRASLQQITLPTEIEEKIMSTDIVRIKFIGLQKGGVTWKLPSGKSVVGADDGINNYKDVTAQDAKFLINTGMWDIVYKEKEPEPVYEKEKIETIIEDEQIETIAEEVKAIFESSEISDAEEMVTWKASELKTFVSTCSSIKLLEDLIVMETRATVLNAIDKRMEELLSE